MLKEDIKVGMVLRWCSDSPNEFNDTLCTVTDVTASRTTVRALFHRNQREYSPDIRNLYLPDPADLVWRELL